KAKTAEMFPELFDVRVLAHCQLNEDEEPVCGACLSDLFPEEEEEEQEQDTPTPQKDDCVFFGGKVLKVVNHPTADSREEFDVMDGSKEHIGLISSCLHLFHGKCIGAWTRTENACPQCKQRYGMIGYYDYDGSLQRTVGVKKRLQS